MSFNWPLAGTSGSIAWTNPTRNQSGPACTHWRQAKSCRLSLASSVHHRFVRPSSSGKKAEPDVRQFAAVARRLLYESCFCVPRRVGRSAFLFFFEAVYLELEARFRAFAEKIDTGRDSRSGSAHPLATMTRIRRVDWLAGCK